MKNKLQHLLVFFGLLALTSISISGCSNNSTPTNNTVYPPTMTIMTPTLNNVINGGTQNYQITWSGTGIATQKTLDYSLDNGGTWSQIGVLNTDATSYSWNVPNIASAKAMVRVTDKNGLTASSGIFSITVTGTLPSITITAPTYNEVITGGTQNYPITWSGTGITAQKTLEYSLDNGSTWTQITVLNAAVNSYNWNVPNVASNKAIIRITDQNGIRGSSGVFTITATNGLQIGETDATINGGIFKVLDTKTIKSALTVTVTATLPKKTDATLDSVQLTLVIPIQGGLPYTIDVPTDINGALINYCIKQYPGGFCNSYKAAKGTGSGTITITNLTPIIEGTFSGTLPFSGGSGSLTITGGAFKAQLN